MTLEQEKISLNSKNEYLQANMESLNIEKEKIQEHFQDIMREREQFLLENQNLSTTTCHLKNRLTEIETKTNCMAVEKEKIEMLLQMNENKTLDLEKERQYYTKQTQELLLNLKEVNEQKELTESELRQQVMARLGAEKQLQAAEKALEHLEMALKMTGAQMTELQEHIMPDVHKLRVQFKEVNEQKELTESELRQQVMARLGAEKQLQAAEKALEHLEMALKMTGAQMTELQEHIMPDVHKLRGMAHSSK
ncbi:hypothetical protein COOONC_02442 [Cooperia oncophora]